MDVLGMIDKAADLFNEAADIYEKVKPAIDSFTDVKPSTLEEAKTRLANSMARAQRAHDSLDAAIAARLGE